MFTFQIKGVKIELRREVVQRYRDQALGEVRRPLRTAPALEVAVSPSLQVLPTSGSRKVLARIELSSNQEEPLRGRVELCGGEGWTVPELPEFELAGIGDSRAFDIELQAPAGVDSAQHFLRFKAVTEAGSTFARKLQMIDYPHIRPTPMPVPAEMAVRIAEISVPRLSRIGYVRGASDRVPEMLQELGLPLEILDAEALAAGNFADYDVIVIGSRAYETDPALVAANEKLLAYAKAGGLLIVQYQQYQFARGAYAPFPLEIDRPHDRITDELAPWRLLDPEHPVFHYPNTIGPLDWMGWVQERGLYFAGSWDEAYTPLLALTDAQGEEQMGGLLVTDLGAGRYVYTGLAFFRRLPAGIPGPYRLFANLLALGRGEQP